MDAKKPLLPAGTLVRYVGHPEPEPVVDAFEKRHLLLGAVGTVTAYRLLKRAHITGHHPCHYYCVRFAEITVTCGDPEIEPLD